MTRLRSTGAIAGVGTTSGVRLVVGRWADSPFGPFCDVMVQDTTGHRTLLAPSAAVAEFVARTLVRGVRTRGAALEGRREWYGATDLHRVSSASGTWRGTDLGDLAPVEPACDFGFSSTPRTPGVTSVVTTVELLEPAGRR